MCSGAMWRRRKRRSAVSDSSEVGRSQRLEIGITETTRLQLAAVLLNRFYGNGGRRSSQDRGVSAVALVDWRNRQRAGPFFRFFDSNFAGTIRHDSWDCLSPGGSFAGIAGVIHHARGRNACQSREAGDSDCARWTLSVHSEPDVSGALSGAGRDRIAVERLDHAVVCRAACAGPAFRRNPARGTLSRGEVR